MSKKLKLVKKLLKKVSKKHKIAVDDVICFYYNGELFFYQYDPKYIYPQRWVLLESYKV